MTFQPQRNALPVSKMMSAMHQPSGDQSAVTQTFNISTSSENSNIAERSTTVKDSVGTAVIVSCEHDVYEAPALWQPLFQAQQAVLDSYRVYDAGAMVMAEDIAAAFAATLVIAKAGRLQADLHRSQHHPGLSAEQSEKTKPGVQKRFYRPYPDQVELGVKELMSSHDRVIHISCHSFMPELDGEVRNTDIGLLYDPVRTAEAILCAHWKAALRDSAPQLRVRRNYPYLGSDHSLTSRLRTQAEDSCYIGIELQLNQEFSGKNPASWAGLRDSIIAGLKTAMDRANL